MDLLLNREKQTGREEKPIRIQVRIKQPTLTEYTECDFADLMEKLCPPDFIDDNDSNLSYGDTDDHPADPDQLINLDSLMAKGAGYDVDDDFIDDTEAQQLRPQKTSIEVPAKLGFYVQRGLVPKKVVQLPAKKPVSKIQSKTVEKKQDSPKKRDSTTEQPAANEESPMRRMVGLPPTAKRVF